MSYKKDDGITLTTLVITIIVLLILASITIKYGVESINEAKIQNIKTNMLLIEAKTQEFVENANYDLGIKPEEATDEMKQKSNGELEGAGKGTKVLPSDGITATLINIGISSDDINNGNVYKLSTSDLKSMGINGVDSNDEDGWYVVVYDVENSKVKVYNTNGISDGSQQVKYFLDDIRAEE